MPRKPAPSTSFTAGILTNLFGTPVITAIILLVGWYFVSNYRMNQSDVTVAEIKKTVLDKTAEDSVARAKIRDDFVASQLKTAEGIAKLDTRLAVAETNQKTANDTLSKIADTLQKMTVMTMPAKR